MDNYLIIKKSGQSELFSFAKLRKSLQRSGACDKDIDRVIEDIKAQLYDGITSREIYRKAFRLLKKENRIYASKYSLKRALFELGPTGYPFERLIAALLKKRGFETQVSVMLPGKCVNHEIDVLAEKDGSTYAIECKFHSKSQFVNNVKIPLYINSRFIDIQIKWDADSTKKTKLEQGWLVTNTKFTSDAIDYANCVNLKLLSWDYPKGNGLNAHIDSYGLYPITTLTTISKREKDVLMENDIIIVTELLETPVILDRLGYSEVRKKRILNEVAGLVEFDKSRK